MNEINSDILAWMKEPHDNRKYAFRQSVLDSIRKVMEDVAIKDEIKTVDMIIDCMNISDHRPALKYFRLVKEKLSEWLQKEE